jgi:hypothetical protein
MTPLLPARRTRETAHAAPAAYRTAAVPRWLALIALTALVVLSGCSAGIRMGYNQAEFLVNWTVTGYVDFEPHQRDLFSQRFRALHAWHRREQLPEYASLVRETRNRAQDGLSAQDVDWVIGSARSRLDALVQRGAGDAAELMVTLTAEQISELERSFAQANRKFVRDWAVNRPLAEQQRARAERLVAQVERFTGRLTTEQTERVNQLSHALPMTTDQRFADRQRRQRELIAALRSGMTREQMTDWFRQWASNWERGREPTYAKLARQAAEQRSQIYADIDRLLTPAQRRTALERLQGYADDFTALAASAGPREQQRAANP